MPRRQRTSKRVFPVAREDFDARAEEGGNATVSGEQ